ncbi:carbohydrate-binding domain-containing protein [Fibrobacter sp. UWB11]|uniref:carbohydrate-binding domain-containing protein n=1 Tax=Fibrobacter sp. UWB11 TaxID=1896202 RepID=UPI0009272071|nr:carbohydrate-binding domain-containing protein [Fibrobacter sp. UWB11]SIO37699.1 repeat domain (List_Bact_rpt) [Fibrobacter sp. UWB11]
MNNPSIFAKARSGLILLVSLLAVSTAWALDPVEYLDESGELKTLMGYTELVASSPSSASSSGSTAGVPFSASSGWYVVKGEVSYDCSDFNFKGDYVNLILTDGAKLTVKNGDEGCVEFGNLDIFVQSMGEEMGKFEVPSLTVSNYFDVWGGSVTIGGAIKAGFVLFNNGSVSISGAVEAGGNVVINDGSVTIGGAIKTDMFVIYNGSVSIGGAFDAGTAHLHNGSVVADGGIIINETADIVFGGATVWARSYTIPEGDGYTVIFSSVYGDDLGNTFSGILNEDQIALIAGKTIAPVKRIVFDDGLDAFEIVWNPGEVPCIPTRYGKKFLGWYADKSFEVPFDFTNFNDEAIAYGLWEDLTEVTYLDENGKEQRVVPDYELVGNECTDGEVFMYGGWVLVKGEVSYKNNFAFLARSPYNPKDPYSPIIKVGTGDVDLKNPSKGGKDDVLYPIYLGDLNVNLILADGAKLTVENDVTEFQTSFNNLAIYAQSTGANQGVFEISSYADAIYAKDALIINGGSIKATSRGSGISSENDLVINNGSITASGNNHGIWGSRLVKINDVVINASGYEAVRSMDSIVVNGGTVEARAIGNHVETGAGFATNGYVDINGGSVTAAGGFAIGATKEVTIAGGDVKVTSSNYGEYSGYVCFGIGSFWRDVNLKGGTVTVSAENGCNGIYANNSENKAINLSGVSINASNYVGPVVIDYGLAYTDGEDNFYTGTLSAEQQLDVSSKTIVPVKRVLFDDGLNAFEIVWNPGEVPCNPSRYGKKFLGWYADKSFEVPFDFTNFNDEAIAYGLWEDLTEVTYLDENGKEQRVVPDYELVGNECTDGEVFMYGGWVLVKGEVSYKNNFAFLARSPYNPKDPYSPIIKVGTGDVDLKTPSKGGKEDILYPIYLGDLNVSLILADGAKLTVENDVTEFQTSFNNLAIYAQSTGANQGVFEISSYADAIYAKDALIINGGSIKATSRGSGISSENDLVINNGSITASGNNHGIWGSRLVKINDGVINASGYEAVRSMDSIVVNGGTVEARAIGNHVETGAGFVTNGYVDINGGSVTAAGGFAIGATKEVTIAGGDVKATSSNYGEYSGYVCFGIGSFWRDVNLKGGTVTVSAENGCNGIYANNSENKAINLSGVSINASSYVGPVVIDDGLTYYDSEGNSFTGTLSAEQQLDIANKYVYPYQPALVIAKDENDNAIATLDGNFEKDLPVIIEQETTVDEVVFNRTFTSGRYATLMFPFDVYADNLIGAKLIDEFGRIDTVKDETTGKIKRLEAHTKAFWDKPTEPSAYVCDNLVEGCEYSKLLKANTPCMVQLDETHTSIEVRGAVKLVTNAPEFAVRYGDWEFVGVYQYKKWTEDDEELLNGRAVYGFVGKAVDGFTIGKFVRIKAGAYINPMRAYMRYNPLPGPQMALRYSVADWNKTVSSIELPESITILRDVDGENHEERTTVIGHFNTHTGDFRLQRSTGRVFDLKGRAYGKDARKARGAYYGKKVIK